MSPEAQSLADLTLALCSIPSVIGNEGALAQDVFRRLTETLGAPSTPCGSEAGAWRLGNSVVAWGPRRGKPLVGLFGHLDTVPAKGENPPRIERDRLFGLGSSDMKGGLALMLRALQALDLQALPLDLVGVFYDREEGPYEENGLGPVLETVTDLSTVKLGICLEPTDNQVQVGCVGSLHGTLRFAGRRAHSARPWHGHNAIHAAAGVLTRLAAREPRWVEVADGLRFAETMQATRVQGGHARNVVPDEMTLKVNLRFAPGRTPDDAEKDLRELVDGDAEVEITDRSPSAPVPSNNPLLTRLVTVSGEAPQAKQAWTDVARLAIHGIDGACLGPGEQAQAHQAGESIAVANLDLGWEILAAFLRAG